MSVPAVRFPHHALARVRHRAPQMVAALALAVSAMLTGCGMGKMAAGPATASGISGKFNGGVRGGQQPISGAKVYLYAASTATAGSATSLVDAPGYALTDANGNFTLTGAYTCPANAMVYLLAVGGNPGLAPGIQNPHVAMIAGLGECASLTPSSFFTINEISTVAAASSFASLASSTTQIGSGSSTTLASAFQNIVNLTDPTSGRARSSTPDGKGIVPEAKIDSLANSLAACINSDGSGSPCSDLFSAATTGGSTPSDTFQAALNIFQQPASNVAAIYNLSTPNAPFQPTLSSAPADWTLAIQYPLQTIVSLSPASVTIPQSSQQGLTASVSGAIAASYRWTTSGMAGLLSEVGGANQTAQTTYCSTSAQATYVPVNSPALTANALDTVTVQAFSSSGCVAADSLGISPAVSVTVTPIMATSILPGFAAATYVSSVTLPAGSTLSPQQLTVVNSVSQVTPAPSGTFMIPTYAFGSQLAIVKSPAGSPMLLGWLDATHSTISAGTTAEVLAYYALGGPLMFTESDRSTLEASIRTAPGLPALTQVIANEIANNPDALAQPNSRVKAALDSFFTSVSGITPQFGRGGSTSNDVVPPNGGLAGSGGGGSGTGILVTPGLQSGLDIETLPPAQADVTNAYRRRTYAFVERVSETAAGGSVVPDPANITEFEVAPVTGLTGGVAGTLSDIYNAYWGNTTTAYGPTTSSPFPIPLVSPNTRTTYHVTIVGPGKNTALFSSLTSAQATAQLQVAVGGFVTDALIPFLSNFVFGSGFPPGAGSASSTVTVQAFQANWKADLQADFLNALSTTPGLQTAIIQGDYKGALASVIDSIRQGSTFRNVLITSVQQAAGAGFVPASMTAALQLFNQFVNAAGGVLQVFDSSVYAAQLKASDAADQWTIVTGGQKITLSPASTNLNQFGVGLQILTAAAPGADTTGFSYFWSNTGLAGDISPLTGNGGPNTGFCSSSNQVQYVARSTPILAASITDTINVQAFSSGNCTAANLLGSAPPASITISPDGVTVSPANSTIAQSGQVPLTAAVNGSTGTSFSYLWKLSSPASAVPSGILIETGGASQTGLSFCSPGTQVTYVPNPSPVLTTNATDAVTVQAFSGAGCTAGNSVGKSQPAGITVTAAGLLVTPRNASVSQNSQQSFAVTLSNAASGTTYSFLWNLGAQGGGTAVGTFQEIGGSGQSGVSFCSTSKVTNYVPNPLPDLTSPSTDIVTVQAFSGTGCVNANAVSAAISTQVTVTPSPTVTSIPLTNEVFGVLEASDGNYYASSQPNFLADIVTGASYSGTCASQVQPYYPCGTIYQITRGGSQNSLFTFPNSGAKGYQPGPMLEGPDGNLYGLTSDGVFFRLSLAGAFTALNTGVAGVVGSSNASPYGAGGFPFILGSDGYFYGFYASSIYRLSLDGEVTLAYTLQTYMPTCSDGGGGTYPAAPPVINSLIEGADGNFYGGLTGQCNGNATEGGSIFQLTRGGSLAKFAAFPAGYISPGQLVQTVDGSFYTVIYDTFRITPSGQVLRVYTPPTQPYGAATVTPNPISSSLALGSDGNFYGSTEALGYFVDPSSIASFDPSCSTMSGTNPDGTNYFTGISGCSKFFQLSPGGGFSVLHTFAGGTDGVYANRKVNMNLLAETDIQNDNGDLIGMTEVIPSSTFPNIKATLFDINNHLPPPIQLSFSSTNPPANSPVTITWNVLNAFSLTAQQCYAFVQGGVAAAGAWTGKQTGFVNGAAYTGSTTITPTAPGTYTYSLTCGGRESGFATLTVQ